MNDDGREGFFTSYLSFSCLCGSVFGWIGIGCAKRVCCVVLTR